MSFILLSQPQSLTGSYAVSMSVSYDSSTHAAEILHNITTSHSCISMAPHLVSVRASDDSGIHATEITPL